MLGNFWGSNPHESIETGLSKLAAIVKERKDLRVFVLLDNPWSHGMAPAVENFNPLHHVNRVYVGENQFIISLPSNLAWQEANDKVMMLTKDWATVIDPTSYICPGGLCNIAEWYRDADHLNPKTVEKKAGWIDPIFSNKAKE